MTRRSIWRRYGDGWISLAGYELRVIGETASAKPTVWGLYRDGQPVMRQHSKRPAHATFDRVRDGKRYVEGLWF